MLIRAIHDGSARRHEALVNVKCAAILLGADGPFRSAVAAERERLLTFCSAALHAER